MADEDVKPRPVRKKEFHYSERTVVLRSALARCRPGRWHCSLRAPSSQWSLNTGSRRSRRALIASVRSSGDWMTAKCEETRSRLGRKAVASELDTGRLIIHTA